MGAQLLGELENNKEAVQELIPDETRDNNVAPQLSRAKVRPRNQVGRKLRIPNLEQLKALEPQDKVVSIPDPDNPDEEWDLVVKELTPGEYVLLHNTAFMRDAQKSREKIEAAGLDPDANESYEQMRDEQSQEETLNTLANWNNYQIQVCLLGIVEPQGITEEIISRWNRAVIDYLYNAIMGTDGEAGADVEDAFPDENTGSGTDNGGSDGSSGE